MNAPATRTPPAPAPALAVVCAFGGRRQASDSAEFPRGRQFSLDIRPLFVYKSGRISRIGNEE